MYQTFRKAGSIRTAGIGIIVTLAALPAMAAAAQQTPSPYEMIVIADSAHGRLIREGRYRDAIEKAAKSVKRQDPFELANNLCVAYTLAKDFENALEACDQAVPASTEVLQAAKANPLISSSVVKRAGARNGAIAYSNRGVLRAMTGDAAGARRDFQTAAALETTIEAPERNLQNLAAREGF